jgi:hypothetical protein
MGYCEGGDLTNFIKHQRGACVAALLRFSPDCAVRLPACALSGSARTRSLRGGRSWHANRSLLCLLALPLPLTCCADCAVLRNVQV